jgi:hypothetical protein
MYILKIIIDNKSYSKYLSTNTTKLLLNIEYIYQLLTKSEK